VPHRAARGARRRGPAPGAEERQLRRQRVLHESLRGAALNASSGTAALREALCRVGASLHARGYAHATAGNLSARLPDGSLLVTATDASLGTLDPAALAHVAPDGTPMPGSSVRPTKALALHRAIYAADATAGAVVHTHATHCVLLTLAAGAPAPGEDLVPPITPYFVMKVGPAPLLPYRRPGDGELPALAAAAITSAAARGAPIRALMQDRVGPTVWHASIDAAAAVLEELEETAKLWWLSGRQAEPLPAARIEELRRVFGASG
jgi:ribulose-5-phosphate 4-epimerase/fuculose-1-phosphate aldolase